MNAERSAAIERLRKLYPPAETKICDRCNRDLPFEEFRGDRRRRDGHVSTCQPCAREERSQRHALETAANAAAIERWRRENRTTSEVH
jgi:hypothetical protein